ncbi:MAG: hypothetical protein AAGD28_06300 [Bacteroidota bacterium]
MTWNDIPDFNETQLKNTRLQLHHAAQIPAIIARSFLGEHHEDVYANLGWAQEIHALVSHPIPGPSGNAFIALQFQHPGILILEESFSTHIPLQGNNWNSLFNEVLETLGERGFDKAKISLEQPYKNDLPEFDTYEKEFEIDNLKAFETMGAYFSNTNALLAEILADSTEASEIRCWPHHFDIASLLDLGEGKSIGVGMSPGDNSSALPYFYVNMWPYPDTEKVSLPGLSSGKWNTEGWVGTLLNAEAFAGNPEQKEITKTFIQESVSAARELIA